jgi:hypothetical protein
MTERSRVLTLTRKISPIQLTLSIFPQFLRINVEVLFSNRSVPHNTYFSSHYLRPVHITSSWSIFLRRQNLRTEMMSTIIKTPNNIFNFAIPLTYVWGTELRPVHSLDKPLWLSWRRQCINRQIFLASRTALLTQILNHDLARIGMRTISSSYVWSSVSFGFKS